jgi:DMSO/TMAO reductase YedYZ molybdopterin-dependent catalytic subunit
MFRHGQAFHEQVYTIRYVEWWVSLHYEWIGMVCFIEGVLAEAK